MTGSEPEGARVPDASGRPTPAAPSTARQTAWNYLVFALSKSSTLLMTIVVARILSPTEFGIFALAILVVNLFDYVKDLGVASALVQNRRDWRDLAPTGLTLSVLFGLFASGLLAATAGVAARALGEPELTELIRVLAVGLAISALSTIPAAWLRRSMNFSARLMPEFAGAVAKTGLTIGLAAAGFGVWSLAYGQLAASVIMTILYWRVARIRPGFAFNGPVCRELVRFGLPVTAVTLLAYAIYNVDYLAVGERLGATELGLYSMAYRIPELLVLSLCVVISEVLFSALSGLQDDRDVLTRHYLQALTVVAALTIPIGIGLAVAAQPAVGTLYGSAYAESAPILSVLAIYATVYSASFHAGDVFKAIGRPGILTAINAGKLAVLVGPIWWAAGHSALAVAVALLSVEALHFLVRMTVLCRLTSTSWLSIAGALCRPAAAAVPMGLVLVGVSHVIDGLADPLELAVMVVVGLCVYVLILRFTAAHLVKSAFETVRARISRSAATPATTKEDL
ncbi:MULTISPECIES: lipopolysaccharide biosynthesis protein [Mycolicibacterium]|uniref:Membrane protein involved in the export of O-antigen and teichoic acid n=1 Tax=Mycolicibacterium gilvum (strain DSM 45189 / LMG 24558 / Spyr1) TaxID=278137 RepID=E6TGP6_MYCSR|nr:MULTISPECIES: lipopolysaccharide biosynthesis protein [Mycolicibacterium]ADU01216.1 membrane protein involved in the export of O-antigen and teichoic acid [Mycolicibacterium gilvum Spyr1]MBV5243845.1 lipopolysaccharide biosynthesis protein [Mycolicibacterium sp. PAM1]